MSEPVPPGPGKKVFVKTWGCQMNVYDSERMTGLLRPLGYAETSTPDDADLIILNTCHIREKASEKLYSELGRLRPQAQARGTTVAVAGCVAQAEGEEIMARAPVVDFVFGPQSYHRLPEVLARAAHARGDRLVTSFDVEEKFDVLGTARTSDSVSAFVTVQEGCDKFCTFCVVPYTRGPEVGRATDQITAEVRSLVAAGVREITLLGQNVNAWRGAPPAGSGDDAPWGLGALCRHLAKIDGLARIRFTTSHPRDMDDELIEALGAEEKLMPYLHLPVQSGADTVLRAMNRGHTADEYRRLVARIRAARPDIAISSDFIVGFPGEDDAAFDATLGLIEDIGFAAAYSFKFSRRPGTPAASMPQQVSEAAKGERLLRLQVLIEAQKQRFNEAMVGRVVPVLFDKQGRSAGQLSGRSPWLQAVFADAPLSVCGQIVPVAVEHTMTNSLAGRLVSAA